MTKSIGPEETGGAAVIESVADVLDRELKPLIADWLARVEEVPDLTRIPLDYYERTGHLPKLVHDVTARVRLDADARAPVSQSAAHHGELRNKQGYTIEMLIEESRLLQVCIFTTLHKNVKHLNFDMLLPDIVTIADEVDAQLRQQMHCYKVAKTATMAQAG
jgi:hypothetical protein